MLPLVSQASASKISRMLDNVVPLNSPRDTASVLPLGPYLGCDRYTARFWAKFGWSTMKCRPEPSLPGGGGDCHAGAGVSAPSRITRRRPGRSVTRTVRASGNATLHGCTSPVATVVTRIRWPVAVAWSFLRQRRREHRQHQHRTARALSNALRGTVSDVATSVGSIATAG